MDKRNWSIVYTDYTGVERKAIELVSTEMGRFLNRDPGVFTLHVLPCLQTEVLPQGSAVVIGRYESSAILRAHLQREDIPLGGYIVKVMDHPEQPGCKLVLIAGDTKSAVFYGAAAFTQDYFAYAAPRLSSLHLVHELFSGHSLPDWEVRSAPKFKTRSVWCWGHTITDYRQYIETMAALRYNQLILWNDYPPINADEIVDYAHAYGIELIWGYAWGWKDNCGEAGYLERITADLDGLTDQVVEQYEKEYAPLKGDGIYFQTFTELHRKEVGGRPFGQVVTQFVNQTAARLWERHPGLHIQFGMHALSVFSAPEQLAYLADVDPRLEILWEDCGAFPYHYCPEESAPALVEKTNEFTEQLIHLRAVNPLGLVYKGQLVMDWTRFVNQKGSYVLGKESPALIAQDMAMLTPAWRHYQAEWIRHGKQAQEMTQRILREGGGNVNMVTVGTLCGGAWLPFALTAELFWDCTGDYDELVERVMRRQNLRMA